MTLEKNELKATVFIPTYNGEKYLKDILKIVFKQQVPFDYEVLIIDSGSKDNTLSIIEKFRKDHNNLRLIEIPNTEYGHGKTRDEAAHLAHGEIVVYLSHDAVPSNIHWLYELVKPFEINDKIVGVMGKQAPRYKCVPLLKNEINAVFRNLGSEYGTTIFYKDHFVNKQSIYDHICFYSDANSAARRVFLTGKLPYKHVPYAEDQVLGRDIIDAGYMKAYAARAIVVHSNDLKLSEYKKRTYDEIIGLRKAGVAVAIPSRKGVVKMTVLGIIKDAIKTILDSQYSFKRKVFWLFLNPFYHIEKWRGVRLATRVSLADNESIDKYSLEKIRARKN